MQVERIQRVPVWVLTLVALIFLPYAVGHAVVLTFNFDFFNYDTVPQGYGDCVTSRIQNGFTYGSGGGFTPNVKVGYGPVSDDVHLWHDDFGDLHNVIYREAEGAGILVVTLTANPGVRVTLNSFDLAGWPDRDYTINSVKVFDENGTALFSQTNVVIQGDSSGRLHTHFSFPSSLVSSVLIIRIDSRNLGFSSDNIGIDNIKFGQVGDPTPHIVAIGDSITAGFQSGVLVESLQPESYATLIATQAGISFTLPLIEEPGHTTDGEARAFNLNTDTQDDTDDSLRNLGGRKNPQSQPYNLAVPGANLEGIINRRRKGSDEPLFELVLQGPLFNTRVPGLKRGTQLAQAVQLNPTLVLLWAGNNDVLGAAIATNLDNLTSKDDFKQYLNFLVKKLKETCTDIVIANIPDVTVIPHMLRVGEVVGDLPFKLVYNCPCTDPFDLFFCPRDITANVEASIVPRKIQFGLGEHPPGSLVPFLNLNTNFEGGELCFSPLDGNEDTFRSGEVLDPDELSIIQERISEFNQVIAKTAQQENLALVDVNTLLSAANTSFTGGIFSLDGIHPSAEGHQLIANAVIDAINHEIIVRGKFGGLTLPIEPTVAKMHETQVREKRPTLTLEGLRSLRKGLLKSFD